MPTSELIGVSEYLHTAYSPDCDYVDGVVEERTLGEWNHARMHAALIRFFGNREEQWNMQAVAEWRVQVAPTRFRIPDVCVVLGLEEQEPILPKPPFICIEVLSSEDRIARVQVRLSDYFAFGVPNVWMIEPIARKGYHCTPQGNTETTAFRTVDPEIAVPLDALFKR